MAKEVCQACVCIQGGEARLAITFPKQFTGIIGNVSGFKRRSRLPAMSWQSLFGTLLSNSARTTISLVRYQKWWFNPQRALFAIHGFTVWYFNKVLYRHRSKKGALLADWHCSHQSQYTKQTNITKSFNLFSWVSDPTDPLGKPLIKS